MADMKKPDTDRTPKLPLHKRLNLDSEMGAQSDQKKVVTIAQSYLDQMKAGAMTLEHISEIDLGGGKYVRTFVIQE
jgi:hypothetical protein